MGNPSGHAKMRLWHFGAAVAVGLVAVLLGVARAQRPGSHGQAIGDPQASQGPDSAVVLRPSQVSRVRRSYGLRRLARWAAVRAAGVFIVAGLGVWSLTVGISSSHWVRPSVPTTATVISSRTNGDYTDLQSWVDVWFRTRSGRIVRATLQPNDADAPARGQKVPIRYNPAAPSQAVYAGPSGDLLDGPPVNPTAAYYGAAAWLSLAIALLLTGGSRLIGIVRAGRTDVATPVRLRTTSRKDYPDHKIAYVDQFPNSYGLEWRLLGDLPDVAGDVRILGEPAAGRWLIALLDDGRLVWPASKAQPVLASAALRLPTVQPGRAGSVRLLLAGYAQIVDLLDTLPVVILRPPGLEADWWLGALGPVVKGLVAMHLRRRLAVLGSGLLRAALLCDDGPGSHSRRILTEASDECREFAATLPRRSLLAALVTIAATGMTIVGPFLLLPHIQLSWRVVGQYVVPVLAGVLIFGVAPLIMFFLSVRCKRALFNPESGRTDRPVTGSAPGINTHWNVYELERAAFAAVGVPRPGEWETRQPIRWLIGAIYLAPPAIAFSYAFPLPMLIVLGTSAGSIAVVKTYRWRRRVDALQASLD